MRSGFSPLWSRVLVGLAVCGGLLLGASLLLRPARADAPSPPRLVADVLDIHSALAGAFPRQVDEEKVVIKEFTPVQDTFVAQKPPYDTQPLGRARGLLFGTEDDLGVTRTFLDFGDLPVPADAEIQQVVLALGIADGSDDAPLAIEVAPVAQGAVLSEIDTTWHNQPAVATPWFVTVVMTRSKWYLYDITPFVSFHTGIFGTRASEPVRLRIRALEEPASGWKGMWSREGNMDLAPHVLVAYVPDTTPPTCALNPLPSMTYGGSVLTGRAVDDRSSEVFLDFQARPQGGKWRSLAPLVNKDPKTDVFTATVLLKDFRGKRVFIRCRAKDRAGNVGPWSSPVQTRVYGQPPHIQQVDAPDLIGVFGFAPIRVEFSHPRPEKVRLDWQDLEVREYPDGEWERASPIMEDRLITPTEGTGVFTVNVGYYRAGVDVQYRLRLRDELDNVGEWHETAPARIYRRLIHARMEDLRGIPLDVFPRVEPSEWIVRPTTPYTFNIYGWGNDAFTVTYATQDRPLMTKAYRSYNRYEWTLRTWIGINENAVRNGDFRDELAGWHTFTHTATIQRPWDRPPYLQFDLFPDYPRFFSNSVGDIVPFKDRSLLVWHEWTVWRVNYHGLWERMLDIPPMSGARVTRWVVPQPVTDTFHALAITERNSRPRVRTYLFEWNPQVGTTSLITLTQTRLTHMDADAAGRIHLLWWDGHTQEMVYRVRDRGQWREQRLPTSGTRASDVVVLALNDTVWAFRRDGTQVCWHTSTDGGTTWGDEHCQEFPALAHSPPTEWAFRAGSKGPFIFDGETLWAWDGATWSAWGDNIQGRLVGCPDGAVRGIGAEETQDGGRVYVMMWDAEGHFSEPQEIARGIRVLPRWLWCGDEDLGGYSALGLIRAWRAPQVVPLLAQAIHVPQYRPTLGFLSLIYPRFPAQWQILVTPLATGSQYTATVHPQGKDEFQTYLWADLSPVAGQDVTLTIGLSTTVYPLFGKDAGGLALVRDIQARSQPYDVAVRQTVRPLDETRALLRLWVQNRRPVTATQLRLDLTWSAPYTLTSLSVPFTWEGDSHIALDGFALEPQSTLYITGTLEVTGPVPITGWVRAWITPTVVDMRPSDNAFETLFISRPRARGHFPLLLAR